MIEKVESQGEIFAFILRQKFEAEGVNFFTDAENPLQLGILKHRQGVEIKPHIHRASARTIANIQEVLHIEYGKVEAHFYNKGGEKVGDSILSPGDTVLLVGGGHGFKMLEDSKIMEIKQGPYYGVEEDKALLEVSE